MSSGHLLLVINGFWLMQTNNSIWHFFASVKLALVTLFLIAVTSIIGTLVPQKESLEWYTARYGPEIAQLFAVLDIPDMYSSWWFLALLLLLCLNLVICSIDRFPGVWKQVRADGLVLTPERLQQNVKQKTVGVWRSIRRRQALLPGWSRTFQTRVGKQKEKRPMKASLLFSQKGAWTRTGVYIRPSFHSRHFSGCIHWCRRRF